MKQQLKQQEVQLQLMQSKQASTGNCPTHCLLLFLTIYCMLLTAAIQYTVLPVALLTYFALLNVLSFCVTIYTSHCVHANHGGSVSLLTYCALLTVLSFYFTYASHCVHTIHCAACRVADMMLATSHRAYSGLTAANAAQSSAAPQAMLQMCSDQKLRQQVSDLKSMTNAPDY